MNGKGFFECLFSVGLAVLFSFSPVLQAQSVGKNSDHHQVIIVGAGMAGISAARYFHSQGINDVVVLEARSRIGGRVWSYRPKNKAWKNKPLDLGAVYVHKARTNPLMKWVKRWSIKTAIMDPENAAYYFADGRRVSNKEGEKIDRLYKQFTKYLAYRQEEDSIHSKQSVSDALVTFIRRKKLSRHSQAGLLYMVSTYVENEYAADITRLSLVWFDNDSEFAGPERVFPDGYVQLIDHLAKPVSGQILLNQKVSKIDYRKRGAVIVTTTKGRRFMAPYVICTVPIGVLQHKRIDFLPALPRNKQRAIFKDIGMGVFNRLYLLFPRVFWDKSPYIKRISRSYWIGGRWVNKGRWLTFTNFSRVKHMPILQVILTGEFALHMQDKPKTQVVDSAMAVLRKIYGRDIPRPIASVLSNWGRDPYSDGSYSSLRPGALPYSKDYKIMALPVKGRLLFAGEATSAKYPGTVHGAYLSGIRAARTVIKKLKRPR